MSLAPLPADKPQPRAFEAPSQHESGGATLCIYIYIYIYIYI